MYASPSYRHSPYHQPVSARLLFAFSQGRALILLSSLDQRTSWVCTERICLRLRRGCRSAHSCLLNGPCGRQAGGTEQISLRWHAELREPIVMLPAAGTWQHCACPRHFYHRPPALLGLDFASGLLAWGREFCTTSMAPLAGAAACCRTDLD